MIPRATIRLQFNAAFTFADALARADYFAAMGFSHIYASPILQARSDSTHGYDVVNPTRIDPKLGGMDGFRALAAGLRARGIGIILDIVPNHLAADAQENPWWRDVLRRGRRSDFAAYFDIDWNPPDPSLHDKVALPILDEPLWHAIATGALRVERGEDAEPELVYRKARYPLRPDDRGVATAIPLAELLARQNYHPIHWSEAATRLNWRRFFDVNELVGLCVEQEDVFEAAHGTLFTLYKDRLVDGFRVDHVDGLADPGGYCRRVNDRLNKLTVASGRCSPAYFIVEKILAPGERMPDWPVDGTTGYDFMNEAAAWVHVAEGVERLKGLWWETNGDLRSFSDVEVAARAEMLNGNLQTDLARCAREFVRQHPSNHTFEDIRFALARLLVAMPVYRTYITDQAIPSDDRNVLARAMSRLRRREGGESSPAAEFALQRLLHGGPATARFQQLSAVLAAKGGEDTAFYRYAPILSRNEVGASPSMASLAADGLHATAARRQASHPQAMLASATHDMKRGEDARMRLAVLSEIPNEWAVAVDRWIERGPEAPRPADQLMLFQTVVGAWPLDVAAGGNGHFAARISQWQRKSLREAKLQSSWAFPNEAYEALCEAFLRRFLEQHGAEAAAFAARISPAGALNALSTVVMKLTMPGVPDLYQGRDRWDFSLVDPDNRSPVDLELHGDLAGDDLPTLAQSWQSGAVKQAVIRRLLKLREREPDLFRHGAYEPLPVEGPMAAHVLAFARRHDTRAIVIATRWASRFLHASSIPVIPAAAWEDTKVLVASSGSFDDVLTGREVHCDGGLALGDILGALSTAVLVWRRSPDASG